MLIGALDVSAADAAGVAGLRAIALDKLVPRLGSLPPRARKYAAIAPLLEVRLISANSSRISANYSNISANSSIISANSSIISANSSIISSNSSLISANSSAGGLLCAIRRARLELPRGTVRVPLT